MQKKSGFVSTSQILAESPSVLTTAQSSELIQQLTLFLHNDGGGNGTNHGHGSSAGVSQHPLLVDLLSNEGKLSAEWLDQLSADDKVHSTLCVMSLF